MPPSIPTSLNFGQEERPPAFYSWPKNVLSFLGKVLRPGVHMARSAASGTLGLAGGRDSSEEESAASGAKSLSVPTGSTPSRKVSRADAIEALHALHTGLRLPELDIGLVLLQPGMETPDVTTEAGQRQALLQATEQVVASVRAIIAQRNAARAVALQRDRDEEGGTGLSEEDLAPPRILLFGRHAELRAQYLAHSCGFGIESGNNPSDCTWPLVLPDSGAESGSNGAPSSGLHLRSDEGIHWSEDLDDLLLLSPASNPAHRFDIILAFGVQLDPADMNMLAAAAAATAPQNGLGIGSLERATSNSPSLSPPSNMVASSVPVGGSSVPFSAPHLASPSINATTRWMEQMNLLLRPAGVFAGIACFDDVLAGDAAALTATMALSNHGNTNVQDSPAVAMGARGAFGVPHLSLPPSAHGRVLSSSPPANPQPGFVSPPHVAMAPPVSSLRVFRDRLEALGASGPTGAGDFFVHTCVDLSMEGEVVFQMPADSEESAAASANAGASPMAAAESAEEAAMTRSLAQAMSLGGEPVRRSTPSPTMALESLVCARFFAVKSAASLALSASAAAPAASIMRNSTPGPSIRRSVSTGALSIPVPGIGVAGSAGVPVPVAAAPSVLAAAGNRSPSLTSLSSSLQRPLKIVTSSSSSTASSATRPSGSPLATSFGGETLAFPPTIHQGQLALQLAAAAQQQQPQFHHGRQSSRSSGGVGVGGWGLPPTDNTNYPPSNTSSASPSPKLTPSESVGDGSLSHLMSLNQMVGVGGRLVGASQHERSNSTSTSHAHPGKPAPLNTASLGFYTGSTSAVSTPRSNASSPGLYPATPHMSGPLREPIVVTGVSLGLPNNTFDKDPTIAALRDVASSNGTTATTSDPASTVPASASTAASPDAAASKPSGSSDKGIFSRLNFERIFSGQGCIDYLTPEDKEGIVGMRAAQVSKDKVTGARVKKYLKDDAQLIQVASKMAPRDTWGLAKEFGLPPHVMEVLDATYELAVCAGLEALRDAGFNLNLDPKRAATPEDIGLPEHMRDETGVIFASSFPCLDSIVQEVTAKVRYDTQQELLAQLRVPRPDVEGGAGSGSEAPAIKEAAYEYDRKLLFKLLVMANSQLAELIKARGPNIHINTACSGTTQAIATAEDWMRVGRCKRVIVVAADVATSPACMPYLATGFLALGAASILPDPVTAAAPFDARRQGMILGAGSVGLVLEYATSALARGATPKVELLGSHQGNSAFHATLMDSVSISQQLHVFLRRIELEQRSDFIFSGGADMAERFTRELIYFAHETFTSANGGCAGVEMQALASIWPGVLGGGDPPAALVEANAAGGKGCGKSNPNVLSGQLGLARSQILVANSKGFTGHPMGVGFEDALAVESLVQGRVPPMANFRTLDPRLAPIVSAEQMSRGGSHERRYVLRMAGGFGNQFVYVLYKKWNEASQAIWSGRLAAGASERDRRGQVHALRTAAGAYAYPLQVASSPNSCSTSAFVSRTSSEANLAALLHQPLADKAGQ